MNYRFHSSFEEYFKINKLELEEMALSSFFVDINQASLQNFREALLNIKDKKILLVGDYDCDGICATAIIKKLLNHLNIEHNYYIPNRNKDGYGLSCQIVQRALDNGFGAILTVDNGVSAFEAMEMCQNNNLPLLIIDHHQIVGEVKASALLHGDYLAEDYKKCCGAGLAYLLLSSFYEDNLALVYAGIATLADMVGVLGFNRFLLKKTIEILNQEDIYTINLLNGNNQYDFTALSFNVIPKINAVSRMEYNPNFLVQYLLADKTFCLKNVETINQVNDLRKQKTNELSKQAKNFLINDININIYYSKEINEGLCGLLANKILRIINKPTIVLTCTDGQIKGSGRSLDNFNIFNYFLDFKAHFTSFGGHKQAMGLAFNEEDLPLFIEYVTNNKIILEESYVDCYKIETENINLDFLNYLEQLNPFGAEVPEPLFYLEKPLQYRQILLANKYPKFIFNNYSGAISFKTSDVDKEFNKMVGKLKKDEYHKHAVNLIIEDLI